MSMRIPSVRIRCQASRAGDLLRTTSGFDRLGRRGGPRQLRGGRLPGKNHRGLRVRRKVDAVAVGDAHLLLVGAHAKQLLAYPDVVVPAVAVIDAELDGALPRPLLAGETEALRAQEDAHGVALREASRLRRSQREVTDTHRHAVGGDGIND